MRPEEVSMRPPEVFVRELAPFEGQRLKRLSRQSKAGLDVAAGADPAGLEHVDERARDRAHAADGRVACAQGDPRLQPARVRVVAPSFRGRATPPDLD